MRRTLLVFTLAAAACGDDNPTRHFDAHMADSPQVPDGSSPDTPPSAVTLTIINSDGSPNPGVHVYFQNADSSVVASLVTDVTGSVNATMAAGGYVTAINPFVLPPGTFGKGADDIETFAGVKPGNHLRLDAQQFIGASVNVVAPPDPDPGVVSYLFYNTCFQSSGSLTPPNGSGANATGSFFLYNCGTAADVLIVTLDDGGLALDFIYAPNQAITDQGTIDLSAMTYTAASNRDYTYTNTPTVDDSLGVFDVLLTSRGMVFQAETFASQSAGPPVLASQALPAFSGAFDAVFTREQPPTASSSRGILDWGLYAATYTLDYQAHLVPDVTSFPAFDPALHQLSWTEAGGNLAAQVLLGRVGAFRQSNLQSWAWSIVAPHDTKLTLPTLPTDLADYNIAADDSFSLDVLISANVPGGYDAVRARALDVLASQNGPLDLINASPGLVAFSQVDQPPQLTRQAPRGWLRPRPIAHNAKPTRPRH